MRRVRGFWIRCVRRLMVRIDVKPDVYDSYYKNEALLSSSAISVIDSYIDERDLRQISLFCPWDSMLIESPSGEFFPCASDCLRQVAPQRRSEAIDDELGLGGSFGGKSH